VKILGAIFFLLLRDPLKLFTLSTHHPTPTTSQFAKKKKEKRKKKRKKKKEPDHICRNIKPWKKMQSLKEVKLWGWGALKRGLPDASTS
jgi:predicted RNase H-like nuclease